MSMTPVYLLLASFGIAVLRHWAKAHKDSQRTYGPKPVLAPTPSPPPKPKPKIEHRTAAQVIEPYPARHASRRRGCEGRALVEGRQGFPAGSCDTAPP